MGVLCSWLRSEGGIASSLTQYLYGGAVGKLCSQTVAASAAFIVNIMITKVDVVINSPSVAHRLLPPR